MKRVVCISAEKQYASENKVRIGNMYHVIDERTIPENYYVAGLRGVPGIWYELLEIKDVIFHSSLFIEINDDQPDEVEILEQRKEKV